MSKIKYIFNLGIDLSGGMERALEFLPKFFCSMKLRQQTEDHLFISNHFESNIQKLEKRQATKF